MSSGKQATIYIAFNFLQKAIGFLLLPALTHVLSPYALGKITFFLTLMSVLTALFGLGLYGAGPVFTYRFARPLKVKQLWGNLFVLNHFACLLVAGLTTIVYLLFSQVLFKGLSWSDFLLLLAICFLSSFYTLFLTYFQTHKKAKLYSLLGILYTTLSVVFILGLVIIFHLGYQGYFYGLLAANVVLYVLGLVHALRNYLFRVTIKLAKQCFAYALPLVPHAVFSLLMVYLDRVFVNLYLGASDLGIYGVASQFALLFGIVITGFNSAYSPLCFEKIAKKDTSALAPFCYKVLFVFALLAFSVSIASPLIFKLFFGAQYYQGWKLLPAFAIAYLFNLIYVFYINVVFYFKSSRVLWVTLSAAIVSLALNYFLVRYFGLMGAAVSFLLSLFVSSLFAYFFSKRLLSIGLHYGKINGFIVVLVLFSSTAYLLPLLSDGVFMQVLFDFIAWVVGCLVLVFAACKMLQVDFSFVLSKIRLA